MKRAIAYVRVSSGKQIENLSLGSQGKVCSDFCEKNQWDLHLVFIEWGESAKTADRTTLDEMLNYCRQRKNQIDYLVVYRVDRFARCAEDHAIIKAKLRQYGVELRSATEPIDDSSVGKFMETVLSGIAELDNRLRADRTKLGLKSSVNIGRWPFPAPSGYLNARDEKEKPIIIIDPKQGPLMEQAFARMATGLYTKQQVLRDMTKLGLRTRKGNKMTHQNFSNLLRNPLYTGWLAVNKWTERKKGNFPPLVDQKTFDKVQAILEGRRPVTPCWSNRPDFPLRRFAKCGKCGAPMSASWTTGRTKRYPYYVCSKHCKGMLIRSEDLEQQFLSVLEKVRMKPEIVPLFQKIVRDVWLKEQSQARDATVVARRRLAELESHRQRLLDAFIYKQAISQEVYQEQVSRLETEIACARHEAAQTAEELDVEAVLEFVGQVIPNAADYWRRLPLDQKQQFQAVLTPSGIVVSENGLVETSVTSPVFNLLQTNSDENPTEGYHTFTTWNQIHAWLRQLDQFRQSITSLQAAA